MAYKMTRNHTKRRKKIG